METKLKGDTSSVYMSSLQRILSMCTLHKLTKKHMNWIKNPMNVAFAVQVLSASIANAIELLMNANHPDFSEAEATIYFLRQCNTLFDIFNTRDIQHNSIYKRALNPENKRVVVDFLENIIDYFKLLNVATDTQKVTPHESKNDNSSSAELSLPTSLLFLLSATVLVS